MPRISIIVPIYQSEATLRQFLACVGDQTRQDFELILVDSGPDDRCRTIAERSYPRATYLKSAERLLPDEASNLGISSAAGQVLVFTDPDVYPNTDWLERLVGAHDRLGGVVVGAVACFGNRALDLGAHLCKFDKWLPGGDPRELEEGPTANYLLPRELFDRYGPFPHGRRHGDTELSWRLRKAGIRIQFEPTAVVSHHHLHSWSSLLAERFDRGTTFGELRLELRRRSRPQIALLAVESVLPIRLITQLARVWSNARRSGLRRAYLAGFPVLASGLYTWLLGESVTYGRRLFGRLN